MKKSLRKAAEQNGKKNVSGSPAEPIVRSTESFGRSSDEITLDPEAELMDKYSRKSEGELYAELAELTAKQKADGSFDPAAIERGVEAISPMLNNEQRRKLNDIIKSLR